MKCIFIVLAVLRRTCNEWRDHLRGLAPGQYCCSKETSQQWRALGDTVSDLTGLGIEPRAPTDDTGLKENWLLRLIILTGFSSNYWLVSSLCFFRQKLHVSCSDVAMIHYHFVKLQCSQDALRHHRRIRCNEDQASESIHPHFSRQ